MNPTKRRLYKGVRADRKGDWFFWEGKERKRRKREREDVETKGMKRRRFRDCKKQNQRVSECWARNHRDNRSWTGQVAFEAKPIRL